VTKRDGVIVDRYLRVQNHPGMWAIGDCAAIPYRNGEFVPPTAQATVQGGHVLARNILSYIDGRIDKLEEFEYRPPWAARGVGEPVRRKRGHGCSLLRAAGFPVLAGSLPN